MGVKKISAPFMPEHNIQRFSLNRIKMPSAADEAKKILDVTRMVNTYKPKTKFVESSSSTSSPPSVLTMGFYTRKVGD